MSLYETYLPDPSHSFLCFVIQARPFILPVSIKAAGDQRERFTKVNPIGSVHFRNSERF